MVYKISKGGVRSGNTLRGLRSLRTRRYCRQACLIGRSSLSQKDVTRLMDSVTDDTSITSTLGSTDVILSMNKKQRWRLPSTVGHMIKAGGFKEQKTMVSLLERHKLKRRANCVSFVCNAGRTQQIAPKQKRYFSFTLNNIDEDESNRQKKRATYKSELKKRSSKRPMMNNPFLVTTYTRDGVYDNSDTLLNSSKPEYRLEIFYPCPQSCSLTYNPKYTDVVMEVNEEGEMEMRANKKSSKSHGKSRKRMNRKDIDYWQSEIVDDDVEDIWKVESDKESQCIESKDHNFASCVAKMTKSLTEVEIFTSPVAENETDPYSSGEANLSENILAGLIAQAERTKALCDPLKQRHRRKSERSDSSTKSSDNKSHVIYVDDDHHYNKSRVKVKRSKPRKTDNSVSLSSVRVILSSLETSQIELKNKFGHLYAEGESTPRRFVISITQDLQNLLHISRTVAQTDEFTSYMVFIQDGFYDEGFETFRVILNSNVVKNDVRISQGIPFEKSSIDEIMNRMAGLLLDMKEDNLLDFQEPSYRLAMKFGIFDFINHKQNVQVNSYHTKIVAAEAMTSDLCKEKDLATMFSCVNTDFDVDMFCGICYEDINPTKLAALPAMQLTKCGHRFCDECWRSHIHTEIRNKEVKIMCPAYQCDRTVDPVTLLSVVHVAEVARLWQNMCEEEVERSHTAKWCPNPRCGRVIHLETDQSNADLCLDVCCSCGTQVCFSCLSSPHWPALCHQAEVYENTLPSLKLPREHDDPEKFTTPNPEIGVTFEKRGITFIEVEGRVCPKCDRFIEKNGGCPSMKCACGFYFCWNCMKEDFTHFRGICIPDKYYVNTLTRFVRVKHIFSRTVSETTSKSGQKVNLYQRALQQRNQSRTRKSCLKPIEALARKIGYGAHKDYRLRDEILAKFGVAASWTEGEKEKVTEHQPVVHQAFKFLNSCQELQTTLLHIVQFTFVLLQDAENNTERRRLMLLAEDLRVYSSFIKSILELGDNQDVLIAVTRLADLRSWSKRGLEMLLRLVKRFRK